VTSASGSSRQTVSVEQRLQTAAQRVKVMRAFGLCLQELRELGNGETGLLAQRSGMPVGAIGKAENGRADVRLSMVYALAQGLRVPPVAVIERLAEHIGDQPDSRRRHENAKRE
jgi:transcriptional regulator with XRE-family HTH domain